MRLANQRLLTLTMALALGGCHWLMPSAQPEVGGEFALDVTPTTLTEPQTFDWTYHRISGKQVATKREDYIQRQVLAFPNATNWAGGLDLTNLGCASGDTMPNGPAAVFKGSVTNPALYNKVFLITKQGQFIKVDRSGAVGHVTLPLNKVFSKTYVTLSPSAGRAYLVSDDGTLFVISTMTMTVLATKSLGAPAVGCAPVYDPYSANHSDKFDEIYVPDNAGRVTKYTWSSYTTPAGLSAATVYNVATGVTPVDGGSAKIEAPPVVIGKVIYVGDQAGGLHMYDTVTPANNAVFFTGSPINTPPAIEIQDGSYAMTNPDGTAKTVARGKPVYAFVTSGASCFWMNLHSLRSYRSMSLYLDDNTPTKTFGYLHHYTYEPIPADGTPITLTDWCAIRTDSDAQLVGAATGSNKTNAWIAAGEIDAAVAPGNDGGPVVCYMRFSTGTSGTTIVRDATLELTVEKGSTAKMPEFRTAPSYLRGTSTVWNYSNITNANRPFWDTTNIGILTGGVGAVNQWGNVHKVNPADRPVWNISEGFKGGAASDYTIVMLYNQSNRVLWEPGNLTGQNQQDATLVDGLVFRTPAAGNADHRPIFKVRTSTGSFPTPTLETPAVIDALRKKVYVFYGNTLYTIDFSSIAAWEDKTAATPKTTFNTARLGRAVNSGGAAFATRTRYVSNFTAPVFNYNLTAAYVLDRYPEVPTQTSPLAWDYSLSKFSLGTAPTVDALQPTSTIHINNVTGEASNFMVIDPFTDSWTTGGNIFFGLGNGKVYQYDR